MFSVANEVGRLVEIRLGTRLPIEEAPRFVQEVMRLTAAIKGRVVGITDLRAATRTVDPEMIGVVSGMLRSENPKIERNALLLSSESATFALQMDRMIKTAGSAARRIFRERAEVEAWLGAVLTPAERSRLAVFLDQA
jgi:hypothetical protein